MVAALAGCCIFPRGAGAPQVLLYDFVIFVRALRLGGAMVVHRWKIYSRRVGTKNSMWEVTQEVTREVARVVTRKVMRFIGAWKWLFIDRDAHRNGNHKYLEQERDGWSNATLWWHFWREKGPSQEILHWRRSYWHYPPYQTPRSSACSLRWNTRNFWRYFAEDGEFDIRERSGMYVHSISHVCVCTDSTA